MELFDLYTRDRVKTGRTMVRGDKVPEGLYRLVVHVCIFDPEGRMLIQQRQPFKRLLQWRQLAQQWRLVQWRRQLTRQ